MQNWTLRIILLTVLTALPISNSRAQSGDWNVDYLDSVLESAAGQPTVQLGDMVVRYENLLTWRNELAGGPAPQSAFATNVTLWPGGKVYYTFDASVSAAKQQAFLDAAGEWATFANLQFIARTTQVNYMLVQEVNGLGGGLSAIGMVGPNQTYQIGPSAWNRSTLCHELGHTLGMVHEHQRSDRDSYVQVYSNNVASGQLGNFVKLGNSVNLGAYDFYSVMHYGTNSFSVNSAVPTMLPLPAYAQFTTVIGAKFDPVLSALDRAGMITKYGAASAPVTALVTNTADSGPGTLRAALYYAFDHPGTTITFNIPLSDPGFSNGVFNILLTDVLPGLANATTLNAASQPGNSNPNGPEILLNGMRCEPLGNYADGLKFVGTNCLARGLIICGFPNSGVSFDGSTVKSNTLAGCYIGINTNGTTAVTNRLYPIQIVNGALGNTIGGTNAADRNVISGSPHQGIFIHDSGTRYNRLLGNYIGLNAAGTAALPNTWTGVEISGGAQFNQIGAAGAGNIISGNGQQGVVIVGGGANGNVIAGNIIGANAAGTSAVPNGFSGIGVYGGAQSNLIGGTLTSGRNVISGNTQQGIVLADAGTRGNVVSGNYIGVSSAGTAALANGFSGIYLGSAADSNLIGGSFAGMGNVISGNANQGILILSAGTSANLVQGNLIGLNAAGTSAIPNTYPGIELSSQPSGNVIGGPGGARNFISGNGSYGVSLNNGAFGNQVLGNTIGLDAANQNIVANAGANVLIFAGAVSNQVGGVTAGTANLITASTVDGVQIAQATTVGNTVRGNSIYGNTGGAIGLYNSANQSIAAPTLTSATVTTNTAVAGSYNGTASTTYQIDFYADLQTGGNAESRTYLGARSITTSGAGTATIAVNLGVLVPAGRAITASATDPAGNTSRLSSGATVSLTSGVSDGVPNAWRALYFGGAGTSTNAQSCATCDPDGDGMNNRAEFLAGTNPTNTTSVLKLIAQAPGASGDVATLASVSGIVYRIEVRDDVGSGLWTLLADQVIGTGGNFILNDPNAIARPNRFYRAGIPW